MQEVAFGGKYRTVEKGGTQNRICKECNKSNSMVI